MAETYLINDAIQHILASYDALPSALISMTDTATTRDTWRIGRQLTEQKKSKEYLADLAKHTFLGMFPSRTGLFMTKGWAFNEDPTPVATHDESVIDTGSIKLFGKTPIGQVYNDFNIQYSYNPERKSFDKAFKITKTDDPDDAGFPGSFTSTGGDTSRSWVSAKLVDWVGYYVFNIDFSSDPSSWASVGSYLSLDSDVGLHIYFARVLSVSDIGSGNYRISCRVNDNAGGWGLDESTTFAADGGTLYSHSIGIAKWTTYVSGLPDYTTAKSWWELCNDSYQVTKAVNPLPDELAQCHWFPDADAFNLGSSFNAAYNYLELLVSWVTKQKYVTTYTIPLNATNIQLELQDPISFSDKKYTNGVNRIGWIDKIKILPAVHKMEITLILEPYDIDGINLIIETGSQPDTITESGSETDTYTEGAQ